MGRRVEGFGVKFESPGLQRFVVLCLVSLGCRDMLEHSFNFYGCNMPA